jgi:hypothetical protein
MGSQGDSGGGTGGFGAASGGLMSLRGNTYAAGGRLLHGPGDGVSDSIPAVIEGGQRAALADSEFVIPARAVSEIGNGSSRAGAKRLEAMLHRIQKKRMQTAKNRDAIAMDIKPDSLLPA